MNLAADALTDSCVLLHDATARQWLLFRQPRQVCVASSPAEVAGVLAAVERAVAAGFHAAGFLAYEAAPAFDPALAVRPDTGFPLAWFGLYGAPEVVALPPASVEPAADLAWQVSVDNTAYRAAIGRIKAHIRAGDTYQVNYTVRLRAPCAGHPWPLFLQMVRAQGDAYGAWINAGPWTICCASPELFFRLDGLDLVTRPMKGTAARGLGSAADARQAAALCASPKERAENLMIVDMARNDLGRIAAVGSVAADPLCAPERYPTVWQLTSTVRGATAASFTEILAALFPAASITGAPKVRTMRIIADLETAPRRIYTGAIGFLAPQRRAQFNVAIRTVLVDRARRTAEYGMGGGIVWDSEAESEWQECLVKARVLTAPAPAFDLLETLAWRPGQPDGGYALLEAHLARLAASAAYFGRQVDIAAVRGELAAQAARWPSAPQRVRLRVPPDGRPIIEAQPLAPLPSPYRVVWAAHPVNARDPFLYHKTTCRRVYDEARAGALEADDVLLYNAHDELTESCIANVIVAQEDGLVTPPVSCGLLAGTLRESLLAEGRVRERVITRADLRSNPRLYLANAVRGVWEVFLDPAGPVPGQSRRH
jgi:para-aminobenzoate synthetase/4-amino-4-deoxychorismate lyase